MIDRTRFVVHGVALTFAHENELSARECRLVDQLSERTQQTDNVLARTKTADVKEITRSQAKPNADFLLDARSRRRRSKLLRNSTGNHRKRPGAAAARPGSAASSALWFQA